MIGPLVMLPAFILIGIIGGAITLHAETKFSFYAGLVLIALSFFLTGFLIGLYLGNLPAKHFNKYL